jgi:hypothetical protein
MKILLLAVLALGAAAFSGYFVGKHNTDTWYQHHARVVIAAYSDKDDHIQPLPPGYLTLDCVSVGGKANIYGPNTWEVKDNCTIPISPETYWIEYPGELYLRLMHLREKP